jgi:hypothetical protein
MEFFLSANFKTFFLSIVFDRRENCDLRSRRALRKNGRKVRVFLRQNRVALRQDRVVLRQKIAPNLQFYSFFKKKL